MTTKSCAIAELHSRHTSPTAAKYAGRYRPIRASWSGSTNPTSVARNIAIVSFPPVSVSHVSRFASAVGTAARQVAACRSPASVASADSSASISASPSTPRLTRRRSRVQRRSVSTARPSSTTAPDSSPDSSSRSAAEVATPANERAYASWWSEPGAADSSSDRSDDAIRASPSGRQAWSAYRRTASAACRSSVCTTLMSCTEPAPPSTSRT